VMLWNDELCHEHESVTVGARVGGASRYDCDGGVASVVHQGVALYLLVDLPCDRNFGEAKSLVSQCN
jgi:hypothetical protein